MATRMRLGRGLSGLIQRGVSSPESSAELEAVGVSEERKDEAQGEAPRRLAPFDQQYAEIPIDRIEVNPFQPRESFDQESVRELAESIRSEGLLQPIVVRRVGDNFQLIAGERRLRACQSLRLTSVAARIFEASDASSATMSLIENLQREGLNPIEEALGYLSLIRDFELTQEAVAERVGKGRATVANALRLLQLSKEIQGYLSKNVLSVGHAKVLLAVDDAGQRGVVARHIIEKGLSVRDLERVIRRFKEVKNPRKAIAHPESDTIEIRRLEDSLASHLNTRVQIRHSKRKGKIVIEYSGNDDLQRILELLDIRQ